MLNFGNPPLIPAKANLVCVNTEAGDIDSTVPSGARTPEAVRRRAEALSMPAMPGLPVTAEPLSLIPIDSPLVLSGFSEATLREFGPMFKQMGISLAQGGAGPVQGSGVAGSSLVGSATPVSGWQASLNPGEAISGLLAFVGVELGDVRMASRDLHDVTQPSLDTHVGKNCIGRRNFKWRRFEHPECDRGVRARLTADAKSLPE